MNATRPTLNKDAAKRRASLPVRPIYTPPPPKPKEPLSFRRWAIITALLAILGWFSGMAVSAWTHSDDVTITASNPPKIRPLPTIHVESGSNTETPADASTDIPPANEDTAAVALADKAFASGSFRQGEVIFSTGSQAELASLISRAQAAGGTVLGVIPGANAARFSFPDAASMAGFLQGGAGESAVPNAQLNPTVSLPTIPNVSTDPYAPGGLSPFGNSALAYMGVPPNNRNWGQGVTVAMLDSGLSPGTTNILKGGLITEFDMTTGQNSPPVAGHGDMVASLLTGANGEQGIIPASPIVSIRVLDSNGQGDVFGVTDGIYTAIQQGAKVINLSLGTYTPSSLLLSAINYALSQGIIVVAAAGNDGNGQISYPAAYPGVVAVGSIDATGQRATFSDYGPQMGLVAPGVGIFTVTTAGGMSFSGTSASSPLVAGAIAGLLSTTPNLTGPQAVQILQQFADYAGPVAPNTTTNPFYGYGAVDMTRVLNRNDPNYTDVALADLYLNITTMPTTPTAPMQVSVQNRGNSIIGSATVDISIGNQTYRQTMNGLQPDEVRAIDVEIPVQQMLQATGISISANVSTGQPDRNLSNNSKSRTVRLVPAGG